MTDKDNVICRVWILRLARPTYVSDAKNVREDWKGEVGYELGILCAIRSRKGH